MKRMVLCGLALFAAFAVPAWSQQEAAGTAKEIIIKKVPIGPTSRASGQEMYERYCIKCHGARGKGDGIVASALDVAPTDLSALAASNNGEFPADRVAYVLRHGPEIPSHGTSDMPCWGDLFHSLGRGYKGSDPSVQWRIANLTKYIESLQE